MITKFKSIIASILVIAVFISLISSISVNAAETNQKTYTYAGYTIEYSVSSSWGDSQTVGVKITNTSSNSINNWAIKFGTKNKINNIWNAVIHKNENNEYIIKNATNNSEIKPNQSVNFGCTITGDKTMPDKFEIVSKKIEKLDGFDVQYKVSSEWGNNFEANVTIINKTNLPIEAWSLLFKGDFTIKSIWNAANVESADSSHSVTSLVWNSNIPANSSISFGFSGIKLTDSKLDLRGFKLTETVISDESSVPENPDVDWSDETDTDSDGLPDIYEINITKTDPKKADTDGDKLPDGYEVLTLGTDPLLTDSDKNSITDDMEDNDSDGLINHQEFINQTDPNSNDTDGDGLSDGDEINLYKTNPLLFDTDGDTIGDGDEIKLQLNPTTQHTTNGVLDSEVKFEQTISSTVTDSINTADSPFTVNINVTATGYADRNLTVGESGYTSVISNNKAIQGSPVELVYENGSVEKVRITFDLGSRLVVADSNERTAIATSLERYHIFRFDEEYNFLYPVNTIEDGNSIYTESDKLGTYCVMDLVEWDKTLQGEPQPVPMMVNSSAPIIDSSVEDGSDIEIDPPTSQDILTEEQQQAKIVELEQQFQATVDELLESDNQARRSRSTTPERKKMDILVAVDSTGLMARSMDFETNHFIYSYFTQSEYFVNKLVTAMNRANVDWRVCLVDFKLYPNDGDAARTIYTASDGTQWITSGADIIAAFDILEQKVKTSPETRQTPWDALGLATRELEYRDGAARHSVLLSNQVSLDENRYGIKDIKAMTGELIDKQVYTHYITSSSIMDRYQPLLTTGGYSAEYIIDFIFSFPQYMVDNILNLEPQESKNVKVLTSSGLDLIDTTQILGDKLVEDFDSDGLINQDEIRGDLMDGDISVDNLLTLKEFVMKIDPTTIDGFTKELLNKHASLLVLPLKSDPRYEDSDGDDLSDKDDKFPLAYLLNAEFIQNMLSLEKLAELYNGAQDNSSDNDIAWLVSMFIRQFNSGYVKKLWSQTGGAIEDEFVEYVKNSDSTLYNFFETYEFIQSGNVDGNVDVRHMAATMCVLLYTSTLYDGFAPGVMPEVYIDSLGGWAGDLQTLMNDVRKHFEGETTDYNIFKSKMQDFLGTEEHSFSMEDIHADTDAYNIYKLTRNLSITEAYSRYYSYGHKKRYSSFTNNDPVILLKNTVSVFTAEKFMSLIRWPLLNYDFTKSESAAACDVFVDFIVSRRVLE